MQNNVLAYAHNHRPEIITNLKELLRIPSISALSDHKNDINRAAQWLKENLVQIGLQNTRVYTTPGNPIVYADWLLAGPQAPTLLIYGHYDVQPVDPLDEWIRPPFEPTIEDNNLYCRGASDDKGQLYIHLAATEAYLKSTGQLPINIKIMLEGEEELGSFNLRAFIESKRELLEADAAFISDTSMQDPQTPVLIAAVRGLAYLEISMRGSRRDLHSGVYGGAVENPLNALVKVLASLKDDKGRITIPSFYDAVRELTSFEQNELQNEDTLADAILAETGAPALWGEAGRSIAECVSVRPTLDIHGIKGGFVGPGQKTVIPAAVSAKLSMRLVPDQNADEIAHLTANYLRQISPATMETVVDILQAEAGATVELGSPATEAANRACEQVFGRRPIYRREGGSIPVVSMFQQILNIPTVMLGFGLPDDNLHAPNEKFHLPNFYRGIETVIHYYDIFRSVTTDL